MTVLNRALGRVLDIYYTCSWSYAWKSWMKKRLEREPLKQSKGVREKENTERKFSSTCRTQTNLPLAFFIWSFGTYVLCTTNQYAPYHWITQILQKYIFQFLGLYVHMRTATLIFTECFHLHVPTQQLFYRSGHGCYVQWHCWIHT